MDRSIKFVEDNCLPAAPHWQTIFFASLKQSWALSEKISFANEVKNT